MKIFTINQFGRLATASALFAGALLAGQAALACDVTNWNGGNDGTINAAQPDDPTDVAARYSGLCAAEFKGGAPAFVQDNSPGGIDRILARFYVLVETTQDVVVYRGMEGTTGLFEVTVATDDTVTLTSGTESAQVTGVDLDKWISIEIDWQSGSGLSLIVNGGAPATAGSADTGALALVRVGNLNGADGQVTVDSYESRRSTAIGRLLECDAQGDQAVNVLDALAVINEINDAGLASAQPDCNEDGAVNVLDALDIINIINT